MFTMATEALSTLAKVAPVIPPWRLYRCAWLSSSHDGNGPLALAHADHRPFSGHNALPWPLCQTGCTQPTTTAIPHSSGIPYDAPAITSRNARR
jgi:hypothetical protein